MSPPHENLNEIFPLVYRELHALAARHLRGERADHTLQPTALVNEAYLKLVGRATLQCADRKHLVAVCAQVTRGRAPL